MKKRIGNDIPIVWTLTDTEGSPYDLTGKEFSVCMKLEGMCVYIPMVYTFTENVISFTFYGKDQPGTGIYDLILREGDSEVTYDVQGAVELVPHSWDEDEGDIDIESEIATNGEVNVIEVVKVNGVALPVVNKAVDVEVPTQLAQLAGDATHRTVTDAEKVAWNAKYDKPAGGIPATDLAAGVIPDVSNFVDETEMTAALAGKQDTISDFNAIRSGAALGATAYQKPSTGIPASDIASGVIPDVSQFITKSVNDLVNYYTKSQTYTKSEVDSLIGAIQGFEYEVVATLPTASADTMGKIYLVPSADPQTANVKDEYITIESSESYTWEQIGSTAIDLSGYVTTSDLNTALASYTTTNDLTTLLAGKQDVIDSSHKLDYSLIENTPTIPTVPAISNDISADASSTTKTASPKAVKDYVDAQAEIYWATYGTTTFNDLVAADAAGKICMLELNGKIYILRNIETSQAYFVGFYYDYDQLKLIYLSVRNTNQWLASSSDTVELRSNMKTGLSSVDNSSYPSTKAVKDYVDSIVGDIESLLAAI